MKALPISLPFIQETPATLRGDPGLLQRGEGGCGPLGTTGGEGLSPQRQLSGEVRGARGVGGGWQVWALAFEVLTSVHRDTHHAHRGPLAFLLWVQDCPAGSIQILSVCPGPSWHLVGCW